MKTCPFPRCTRRIPNHFFACRLHWDETPEPERRLFNLSVYQFQQGQLSKSQYRRIIGNIVNRVLNRDVTAL